MILICVAQVCHVASRKPIMLPGSFIFHLCKEFFKSLPGNPPKRRILRIYIYLCPTAPPRISQISRRVLRGTGRGECVMSCDLPLLLLPGLQLTPQGPSLRLSRKGPQVSLSSVLPKVLQGHRHLLDMTQDKDSWESSQGRKPALEGCPCVPLKATANYCCVSKGPS